jgi:hypothetical protein
LYESAHIIRYFLACGSAWRIATDPLGDEIPVGSAAGRAL